MYSRRGCCWSFHTGWRKEAWRTKRGSTFISGRITGIFIRCGLVSLAGREWGGYAEAAENFTMAFFGRAKLPWRFVENKPVALVFFLRPEKLPAVFEIKDAAITRRVAE
ncbi:MAG: hypothetical protein U5L01_02050 [Rheinheimera sp.]|nr:hypothetical protein [Rheinheimera sp.]